MNKYSDESKWEENPSDADFPFKSVGEQRELGCLPFPPEDVMLVGQTKRLHLYEARFLALLEDAIKKQNPDKPLQMTDEAIEMDLENGKLEGGPLGYVVQSVVLPGPDEGQVAFAGVASLLAITKFRRLRVGAHVSVQCVGRVRLDGLEGGDPFLFAAVSPLPDVSRPGQVGASALASDPAAVAEAAVSAAARSRQGSPSVPNLVGLSDELLEVHADCCRLEKKLVDGGTTRDSMAPVFFAEDDPDMIFGHESSDDVVKSGAGFERSLKEQWADARRGVEAMYPGPQWGWGDYSGEKMGLSEVGGAETMKALKQREVAADCGLLGYVAASCFGGEDRLNALVEVWPIRRMERVLKLMKDRRALLAAKAALIEVDLD